MLRHYYITDDLDDLQQVEQELLAEGLTEPQLHVLSEHDADVENHQLNEVESVLRQDVVHSTEVGFLFGVVAAVITLLTSYLMGWTEGQAGWLPFNFLAVVVFAFCTWEGGFLGIQRVNVHFARFQDVLRKGKHIFFADISTNQEQAFARVVAAHPHLQAAGTGHGMPQWLLNSQNMYKAFIKSMP